MTLANRLVPGGAAHQVSENIASDRDVLNLLDRFPPHLDFTEEEEAQGESCLRTMGIPVGAPFVCLIVRDSAYLDDHRPGSWRYHDYRDSDIQNYVLAAEELADRGYFVLRMGSDVVEAMPSNHPRVIDYATNGMRNDFMDIYLGARCEFCISSACGFDCVPLIFRRPVVSVNVVPVGCLWTSGAQLISITRHYYSADAERDLTLREIFTQGAGFYMETNDYDSKDIQLIENTPEEVRDIAVEMDERLRGRWQTLEGDEALQTVFWEVFHADSRKGNGKPLHGEIHSRYGAAFLRDNPEWLD
jgi:putative glycosyltransferase (TIGR04372 family)